MNEMIPQATQRSMVPNSNFSFVIIDKETWEQAKINNSLFNGAVFGDCLFRAVCFDHSDLEGTRFINCRFIDCSMVGTETRSIWAVDCTFQRVDFSQSSILDSNFHNCQFTECLFDGIVQSTSVYDGCIFDSFLPKHGSITLSRYTNTTFRRACFRNVFYYHIFESCTFEDSSFEAYLLGYVYGLTAENLRSFHSLLMGAEVDIPLPELYEQAESIYVQRKMGLNVGILRLGIPDSNIESLLISCVKTLEHLLQKDQILKTEQIQYLSQLIDYLQEQNKIAPITFLLLEQGLRNTIDQFSISGNTAWEKAKTEIKSLRNRIYFSCLEILDSIYAQPLPQSRNEMAVFKITYQHQPELSLAALIAEMSPNTFPAPKRIKTAQGSWIEWISAPDNVIVCLTLFVSLLSGVVLPIFLDNRKARREKEKEEKEQAKKDSSTNIYLTLAAPYMGVLPSIAVRENIPNVLQVIVSHGLLESPSKKGFDAANIRTIEILSPFIENQDTE